jgi:hypothetical protein
MGWFLRKAVCFALDLVEKYTHITYFFSSEVLL